jgi:TonB-dependent receptor
MRQSKVKFKLFALGTLVLFQLTAFTNSAVFSAKKTSVESVIMNSITGKVVGAENEPLVGVSVFIKKLNLVAFTDYSGQFTLRNVPNGDHELSFSYLGYKPLFKMVSATTNVILDKVVMEQSVTNLGEVVVSASFEGQQKAYNQQKNSENIKSIVSADLIGRFPDVNVAESLQRVSGISIQRDNGEGSVVQIRGTPLNYTTIAVNGEQISSTGESGERSESLDLISADQLAAMEITKAITPDMDGDATGGAINLVTPMAKSSTARFKGTIGSGYNDLYNAGIGTFKLGYDQRFLNNKLGVLVGGSHYTTVNGEERIETTYGLSTVSSKPLEIIDFSIRPLQNTRSRTTVTSTIDYKFSETSKIYFNFLYSNLTDESVRNRLRIRPRSGTYTDEFTASGNNVEARRDVNDRTIAKNNYTLNFGGKHDLKALNAVLDYELFYTTSERELQSRRHSFRQRNFTLKVDRSNPDFPIFSSPNANFNDYSKYNFLSYEQDLPIRNSGKNLVYKFNITKPLKIGDNNAEIKFGAKLRDQTNERRRSTNVYDQLTGVYDLSQVVGTLENNLFNKTYQIGFSPNFGAAQKYYNDNSSNFVLNEAQTRGQSDSYYFDANERIFGSYLQGKIQLNKLMVLAGIRLENTRVKYDAFRVDRLPSGLWKSSVAVDGKNNFDFLLPMLHLKYELRENQNLRFSATKTYSRPNFDALVPNQDVNVFNLTLTRGNPQLVPAKAVNIDLMYEAYFKNSGVFSAGFFYKNIEDFIFTQQSVISTGEFAGFSETTPINGDVAKLLGFEMNFSKNLSFLPGVLSGLGTFLNYTYTQSESTVAERKNVRFPGQANHIWNAALTFDRKKFSSRASLNYNGSFITSISSDPRFDFYAADRYQLDVNASYKFSKKITVFTEFVNLTNSKRIEYQLNRSNPANIESYGWSSRFGLNFKF